MEAVWKKVKSTLKHRIPGHSYKMWIEPLTVSQTDESGWVVYCPNFFSKKRVQGLYGAMIKNAIQRTLGQDCELLFKISNKTGGPKYKHDDHLQLPLPNTIVRPSNGHFFRQQQ